MSLLQHEFLKVPLENALVIFNKHIVPRLTKKNKSIAISAAVAMSVVYFITELLKPPKKLRHIPYVSHLGAVWSSLVYEPVWDRAYRVHLPELTKKGHPGLFMEQGRFGWALHIANPEDAKRFFLKTDLFPKVVPQNGHKETIQGKFIGGPNMLVLNGHEWKAQRKVANPAFHRSMPVKLFGKLTQDMFKVMEGMGETIVITDLLERWTLDAIGKAGFDFDFNALTDEKNEWVQRYSQINIALRDPKFHFFPSFDTKWLSWFPQRAKVHKELDIFLSMLDDVISKKRAAIKQGVTNDALEENERDLLGLMIEAEERGEGIMDNEELKSNLCVFFLAGHDTTSSALAFAIHYLAQNPDIQQKAREEAIHILGDEPEDVLPTLEETRRMTYINQIMKETLRINGPTPRILPRVATEDTYLSNTFIPKGTWITVNMFDIQHNDNIWKDSQKFDPERFAEDGEAVREVGEGLPWLPFGNGGRQCIGMNFSLSEQRVMLSMLLRKYTWETPENSIHKERVVCFGVGIIAPQALDIKFQKRY
ncbi:hypothetical protein INT47_009371 [Mucor saturninus]|uniref:Cytochrome P450 n=1 Tax=Mucor saturninus TaxID=64648 RepID=A0A8H7R4E1_9FUNG|nr:hypothetical protein INT47_009371 [Mucor saturninus]